MSQHDDDFDDDDATLSTPPAPSGEGVRIIGADEAQAVIASGKAAERIPADEPRHGDVPEAPIAPKAPAASFPTPGGAPVKGTLFEEEGEGPTWSAATEEEPTAAIPMPHWTEPPTGEVAIVFEGDELEPIDTVDSSAALRFRTEAEGWEEETSLHEALAVDEPEADELDVEVAEPLIIASSESDDDFDAEVQARRGRRSTATPSVRGRRRRGPAALPGTPQPMAPVVSTPTAPPSPLAPPSMATPAGAPANLPLRLVVGGVMAAVAIVFFLLGTAATTALVAVVAGIAAIEIYGGLHKQHARPATLLGIVACAAMPIATYNIGERAFPVVMVLLTFFSMLWYLFGVSKSRPVVGIAMTLLGFAYVGIFAGFAGLLLAGPDGIGALIGVAACAIAYDVAGYLVGSTMGKTRIAPHVSPNKTLEGLLAGMGASLVVGGFIGIVGLHPWNGIGAGLALGLVCAVIAPIGDLCESLLKRDIGIKDFGDVLPGHGGVLDRFDTILFCLPAAFYLLVYLVG